MKGLESARLLGRHHEGRRAELALEIVTPELDRYEKKLLDDAKEAFRAGHRDAEGALLMLAQLVAVSDLRERLKSEIKRGNRAMERLMQRSSGERA